MEDQNIIKRIKEEFKVYDKIIFEEKDESIILKTQEKNGFDISIFIDESECTVYYEGWHEHFQINDEYDILECIRFGLSDKCRIKIISRRSSDCTWILEAFETNKWIPYNSTGLIFCCWWCKKHIRYLSNKIISEI